jgi:hypothetical protein
MIYQVNLHSFIVEKMGGGGMGVLRKAKAEDTTAPLCGRARFPQEVSKEPHALARLWRPRHGIIRA